MTKLCTYIRKRGLLIRTVAQKLGTSSQNISKIGENGSTPTLKTLEKVASVMTELGAPTTVVDLTAAICAAE